MKQFLLGDNSDTVPPDPIPNSEVKRISGDGSVGSPHVRVAIALAGTELLFKEKADLRVSLFLYLK